MAGDRDHQYPPRRDGYAADPGYRAGPPAPPPDRYPPPREEYASDQVKDLLELYFRDPQAFDQYAKTYYYGERMERARATYASPFLHCYVTGVEVYTAFSRLLESPGFFFVKIPGPGKSWKITLVKVLEKYP